MHTHTHTINEVSEMIDGHGALDTLFVPGSSRTWRLEPVTNSVSRCLNAKQQPGVRGAMEHPPRFLSVPYVLRPWSE